MKKTKPTVTYTYVGYESYYRLPHFAVPSIKIKTVYPNKTIEETVAFDPTNPLHLNAKLDDCYLRERQFEIRVREIVDTALSNALMKVTKEHRAQMLNSIGQELHKKKWFE